MRIAMACAVAVVGLGGACLAAPPLQVLLRSGDRAAGGPAIASIQGLVAAGPRDVAFVSESTAVALRRGGAAAVAFRTGDPLPPPSPGTIRTICCAAMNDQGDLAFAASLDGGLARSAVVLRQGAQTRILPLDGDIAALSLNARGEVAYRRGQALYLWPGAGEPLLIVTRVDPVFGRLYDRPRLGRLLASGAEMVVFAAAARRTLAQGIFAWGATSGVTALAVAGEASPVPGDVFWEIGDHFDANGAGDVAFVATVGPPSGGTAWRGVFRHSASTGAAALVVRTGDFVGGESLLDVDPEFVGIDDTGGVTFQGTLASGRALIRIVDGLSTAVASIDEAPTGFAPTPDSGGRVAWLRGNAIEGLGPTGTGTLVTSGEATDGPGSTVQGLTISAIGDAAWVTTQRALHRLRDGALSVVRYDDGRSLAYTFRQGALFVVVGSVAVGAAEESQLYIGTADRDLIPLVRSGVESPYGEIRLAGSTLDSLVWRGDEMIFAADLRTGSTSTPALMRYQVGPGTLTLLASVGGTGPSGMRMASVSPLPVAGGPPMLLATYDGGGQGIIAVDDGVTRAVLATGEAQARRRAIKSIADVAVDGSSFFAVATAGPGGRPDERLLAWTGVHGRRARTLARSGQAAPGGGRLATFGRLFAGNGRALLESLVERRVRHGVVDLYTGYFLAQGGRLARLLAEGDPVVGGTAIESVAELSLGTRGIAGIGTQRGADSYERSLVFQLHQRAVTALAVEGEQTPVGGAFVSFDSDGVVLADGSAVILAQPDGTPGVGWALLAPAGD